VVPAALFSQLNAAQVAHAAPDGAARGVFNCAESLDGQVRHPVSAIFERGQLRFHVRASVRACVQINVKRVCYIHDDVMTMTGDSDIHCFVLFKFESIEIIVKIEFAAFLSNAPPR
jgi:hypothetical protein